VSDTALCRQCRHMRREDDGSLFCAALAVDCKMARSYACEDGEFFEEQPDTLRMLDVGPPS
jgi:hypothetical protein